MKWMKSLLSVAVGMTMLTAVTVTASEDLKQPRLMDGAIPVPSALLMQSYRYMGKLRSFSIDAVTTSDELFLDKMLVTYTHHVHIDIHRPYKLHIWVSGDLKEKAYYLNTGAFTVYDALKNYYGRTEIPKTIDKALDYLFEKYDVKSPLANILYSDLDRRIPPKEKGYYFGKSEVDDIICHHIGFVTSEHEFQVWIEEGEKPLIRKFIIIDKTEPSLPRSGTVLRWKLDTKLKTDDFVPDLPADAVRIDIEPVDEWEAV
jgi:hypothetical protein